MSLSYIKRVVLVTKSTRWEHERRNLNLDGLALSRELERLGYPVKRIKDSHDAHSWSVDHLFKCLGHNSSIGSVVMKKAQGVTANDFAEADLVISAGGDGTLLLAAGSLPSGNTPVLSVNTDPLLSSGSLCSVRLWRTQSEALEQHGIQQHAQGTISTSNFGTVLEKITRGSYRILPRERIRVDLIDETGRAQTLDRLALNEVFYSERDASRPSVHETIVEKPLSKEASMKPGTTSILDYGVPRVQRSSGVIVCTGTGSTAWMLSASMVPSSEIYRVLDEAANMLKEKKVIKDSTIPKDLFEDVLQRVQTACIFPPTSRNVQYYVREPVLNGWYGRHDTPFSSNPRRGFCNSVSLKALGWDVAITMDGLFTYRMRYGTTAFMRVDPTCPLHAVWFLESTKG